MYSSVPGLNLSNLGIFLSKLSGIKYWNCALHIFLLCLFVVWRYYISSTAIIFNYFPSAYIFSHLLNGPAFLNKPGEIKDVSDSWVAEVSNVDRWILTFEASIHFTAKRKSESLNILLCGYNWTLAVHGII